MEIFTHMSPESVLKLIDSKGGFSNAVVTFTGLLLCFKEQNEIQIYCGLNWNWFSRLCLMAVSGHTPLRNHTNHFWMFRVLVSNRLWILQTAEAWTTRVKQDFSMWVWRLRADQHLPSTAASTMYDCHLLWWIRYLWQQDCLFISFEDVVCTFKLSAMIHILPTLDTSVQSCSISTKLLQLYTDCSGFVHSKLVGYNFYTK